MKIWIPYNGPRVRDVVGPFEEGTQIFINGKKLGSLLDMDVLLDLARYKAEYDIIMSRHIKTCKLTTVIHNGRRYVPAILIEAHTEAGYYTECDDCDPDN